MSRQLWAFVIVGLAAYVLYRAVRGSRSGKLVYLTQDWPPGITAGIFKLIGDDRNGIRVAGISQYPHEAAGFIAGRDRTVELVREPTNPHDPNAIRVIGHWVNRVGTANSGTIGYLPREYASNIAHEFPAEMPLGAKIIVLYPPGPGRNAGVRLNVGRPPLPNKPKKPAKPKRSK
jgi:hypothetical protein